MPAPLNPILNRNPSQPLRLAVLISGGGSTMQNIADHIRDGRLHARIDLVLSSRPNVRGLERAAALGVPTAVVARKDHSDTAEFSKLVFARVRDSGAELVALAGFMSLLVIPPDFVHRVINIHPALLPAFGGHGMYGHHVHEAVLARGCKLTGCTVHFADPTYDTGPIILQRACEVRDDDTPDTLAARVQALERQAYPQAIGLIAAGKVTIEGARTHIAP
jgi:phosphoribosylglycinamide formyltransferase 1